MKRVKKLLPAVKKHLILSHDEDDDLLIGLISAAMNYAENYQHLSSGFYDDNPPSPITEQAVVMLACHFYESRDGSTGGFFGDNVQAYPPQRNCGFAGDPGGSVLRP